MKVKIFAFLLAISLCSCDFDNCDDKESIPYTDSSSFITKSSIRFQKRTDALHIYNCMNEFYGNGEFSISGTYTVEESVTLLGEVHTEKEVKTITSVKIYPEYITKATNMKARTS